MNLRCVMHMSSSIIFMGVLIHSFSYSEPFRSSQHEHNDMPKPNTDLKGLHRILTPRVERCYCVILCVERTEEGYLIKGN